MLSALPQLLSSRLHSSESLSEFISNTICSYSSVICCVWKVYGFDVVLTALLRYKELHGDLIISQRFTVPSDSADWPQAVWNMKLG